MENSTCPLPWFFSFTLEEYLKVCQINFNFQSFLICRCPPRSPTSSSSPSSSWSSSSSWTSSTVSRSVLLLLLILGSPNTVLDWIVNFKNELNGPLYHDWLIDFVGQRHRIDPWGSGNLLPRVPSRGYIRGRGDYTRGPGAYTYRLYSTYLQVIQYILTGYTVHTYRLYSTNLQVIQYTLTGYTVNTYR